MEKDCFDRMLNAWQLRISQKYTDQRQIKKAVVMAAG